MRTRCQNAKLDKEAEKLSFGDTCCYNFKGVPEQYGCTKPKKLQSMRTHRKKAKFFKKGKSKP